MLHTYIGSFKKPQLKTTDEVIGLKFVQRDDANDTFVFANVCRSSIPLIAADLLGWVVEELKEKIAPIETKIDRIERLIDILKE